MVQGSVRAVFHLSIDFGRRARKSWSRINESKCEADCDRWAAACWQRGIRQHRSFL